MKKFLICLSVLFTNSCNIYSPEQFIYMPEEDIYMPEEDIYMDVSGGENCKSGECLIPGGVFIMGRLGNCSEYSDDHRCPWGDYAQGDERPAHEVLLRSFYLDQYEVSVSEYKKCVENGKCTVPDCYSNNQTRREQYVFYFNQNLNHDKIAVNCITWEQANQYCKWVNKRLPTEAEWEYAAAGKYNRAYSWGYDVQGIRCVDEYNAEINCPFPFERGQIDFDKSVYNVYDLMGSVKEWVQDWYHPNYYTYSERENPTGPNSGTKKVIRGGSTHNIIYGHYYFGKTTTFSREFNLPDYVNENTTMDYGFRCARDYE